MTTASIQNQQYQVSLTNQRHQWMADEPPHLQGTDTGPTPDELLESALASCTAITLRMYANRKAWPLRTIEVTVALERTTANTHFRRIIHWEGELDAEQQQRLLQIAKSCPVSKTLSGAIQMETELKG